MATATPTDSYADIREGVAQVCAQYSDDYWRSVDERRDYPEEFVRTVTDAGYLGALIPEEFGGLGLGVREASVIMETINRSGANGAALHAQMYVMSMVLRHGSEAQKREFLPGIAGGALRLQAFAVTEPNAGTDTTSITTTAVREGDVYRVRGQKVFISRVQHSDLMILLARTAPLEEVQKRSQGLSVFLVDLRDKPAGLTVKPIPTMINHETNELFFDDMLIPASSLIGQEGSGFKYILDGMNAERILIAAECIGDGRWFIERTARYVRDRKVFGRPIGQNQGVQFPLARAHVAVEAADLMRWKAAELYDAQLPCGPEANMAKLLAADASWEAANVALQSHGGLGFAVEADIERKFRETRLYQVAPISTNLILSFVAEHVLGLPRSY